MDSYLPRQISQSDCEISSNCGKKLFRQRLSHKSVEAYVTMSIGIMGSNSLALLD